MMQTNEGALTYEHSLDHAVEFFSKAGSLFEQRGSFYKNEDSALGLFQKTWIVDPALSFRLLLWLRDCRGGAGNRSGARVCYKWLAENDPKWLVANIKWLPLVGRWDDLRSLFGTRLEKMAAGFWLEAITKMDVLAAKWADRSDKPLRYGLQGMREKDFRKLLSFIRKSHIVEYKMCSGVWREIEYEHVPSVAMARYTKAFDRHDEERFDAYKASLKKGEAKIHSSVLFPHDCVRTAKNGDYEIADAQFEALPNFMSTDSRVMVICDTSGSMDARVSGSIKAVDISQGLALYCSAMIPKDNPFHKKFIGFESEGSFKDWNGMPFSQAVNDYEIFDTACGGTQIGLALDMILSTAKFFNLPGAMLPNILLIVSDMQFHQATYNALDASAEVESCLQQWIDYGYPIPKVVYWNTAGYAGSPATIKNDNVGLISGFSPSILKAVFEGQGFSPREIMLRAIEKYNISIP